MAMPLRHTLDDPDAGIETEVRPAPPLLGRTGAALVLVVVGMLVVTGGVALLSVPAGIIVGGALLLVMGVLLGLT